MARLPHDERGRGLRDQFFVFLATTADRSKDELVDAFPSVLGDVVKTDRCAVYAASRMRLNKCPATAAPCVFCKK
jgi:hypothetical protein